MLDRRIKFPSLKQGVAKTVTGKKVIGPYCNCFLVVSDRVVDSSLLKKSIGQGHLSIWIVWLHPDCFVAIENRLVYVALPQKSGAKIVIGIPKIGLHLQRRPIMHYRIVKLAFFKQDQCQVVANPPAARNSGKSRCPEPFGVGNQWRLAARPCSQEGPPAGPPTVKSG